MQKFFLVVIIFQVFGQELQEIGQRVSSFLESKNQINMRDSMLLQEYERVKSLNKDLLTVMDYHKLTKKNRRTQQGYLCQQQFSYKNRQYQDCTSDQSPDGQQTYEQWCMEVVSEDNPNGDKWGFCQSIQDYDLTRKQVRDLMKQMIPNIRQIKEQQQSLIPVGQRIIEQYSQHDTQQSQLTNELQDLQNNLENLQNMYQNLLSLKTQWEDMEQKNEGLEKEITILQKQNQEDKSQNCDGLLGYEEDSIGDGLNAFYYDNENYESTPISQIDENINFEWSGQNPHKDINSENYSIKWQGFIKIPVTAEYIFKLECDDSGIVYINDNPILQKNFQLNNNGSNYREKSIVQQSKSMYLIGGMKYAITVQISHSNHNFFIENQNTFAKLYWSSNQFSEQIINKSKFYKTNKIMPLKITDYQSDKMQLTQIQNYIEAFIDSQSYLIDDVPLQYANLNFLRTKQNYQDKKINFKITAPATVYIAINDLKQNPLPFDFLSTEFVLSVLKVSKNRDTPEKKIKAHVSLPFKIYKKNFAMGEVDIPINTVEKEQYQFIVFYQLNSAMSKQQICGGQEKIISLTNSESFQGCLSSSEFLNNQQKCTHGFSGKMMDVPYGMWASNAEGISSWIEVKFNKDYQITKLEYKNRENQAGRNKQIQFKFKDDQILTVDLRNSDNLVSIPIQPPIISSSLRMTVTQVYSTYNNGGAINVYGVPCRNNAPESFTDPSNMIILECSHTLVNNEQIIKRAMVIGSQFLVNCISSCANEQDDIWGAQMYSEDSSICKSAYHSGILPANGGEFIVKIEKALYSYQSEIRNGINSKGKKSLGSGQAITFVKLENQDEKINEFTFTGMQVDIFDTNLKKWIPGNIESITQISKKEKKLLVSKEGYSKEFNQIVSWYNPQMIDFCGEKINDRKCNLNSKKPQNQLNNLDIKLCFTAKQLCPQGYIVDNGAVFQAKGQLEYGWAYSQEQFARSRGQNPDQLLDNFILFPPDLQSQWCLKETQVVSCQPNEWKIKVPNGSYNVKITVGDPKMSFGVGIEANDKYVIEPQILNKNQFFTNSKEINVIDGFIKIKSKCEFDCYNYWSRINAIEISKDQKTQIQVNEQTQSLGCGNSFQGGRCINGPNVEDCIYDNVTDYGAEKCVGFVHLVKIPNTYSCVNQRGKFKCIQDSFLSNQLCKITCPGQCKLNSCMVPNFVFN